jgi:hypothetical protein
VIGLQQSGMRHGAVAARRRVTIARCMTPFARAFAIASLCLGSLAAQDDHRDRLVRTDGRELTGRVVDPFASDELTLLQGGKRVRVARKDVARLDLVADRVRTFCERRVRQKDSKKAQQFLVDQAHADGLPGLARLQALWLVLQDDGDERAHEYLGHVRGAKGWLWELDGRRVTKAQFDAALQKEPIVLTGERFALRCDVDLATNVAALLDLEHLGVAWFAQFGDELGLREVLRPIDVVAFRSAEAFPKWGFRPMPYYVPAPHGDQARTFYSGPTPARPERLFFVGAHALLYHSLIGEVSRQDDRDRVCAWLEVGLAMWMEHTMQGPAGFAAPGPPRAQDLQALAALGRGYRLTHLLHLPMYGSFYLTDDVATATNWSAAAMFVAWLLQPDNQPATRAPFVQFVRGALGERKGDSSSVFDRLMGRRVEDLDAPWRQWLAKTAGN